MRFVPRFLGQCVSGAQLNSLFPVDLKAPVMTNQLTPFTILVVDDEDSINRSLQRFFARDRYRVLTALDGVKGLEILASTPIDLLILDLKMPGMGGMEVLEKAKSLLPDLKVIIQTGHGGIAEAVEAIKLGASDFLEKGSSPEILKTRVGKIHDIWLLENENRALRVQCSTPFHFEKLVGESLKMKKLKDMIARVSPTDTTVLLQGESGTGKELVAQAIHHHSNRAEQPFVAVDCAAISETVIESELFGHTKGAFTGADSATLGLIRSADKGTLFLDEIGELSAGVQARFLRAIQERIVRPVGSTKNYKVDIRIVAATNRNVLDEVAKGNFRQDLYYRLSTVTLTSPPLRERPGDIDLLIKHILTENCEPERNLLTLSPQARQIINSHQWPGNVRELDNVLRGAMVFADGGEISVEDLPRALAGNIANSKPETSVPTGTLASFELEAMKNALHEAGNNRRKAAKILDIAEATLYRKIKQYGL
jgi:DNA-binding NtrC family response regulator